MKSKLALIFLVSILLVTVSCSKNKSSLTPAHQKPGTPEYYVNDGVFHLNRGNLQAAEKSFLLALKKKRNHVPAINAMGIVCLYKGDFKKAVIYFKKVLSYTPLDPDARNSMGIAYSEIGDYDKAKENFITAANSKNYSTPENAFLNLAKLEMKKGKYDSVLRYADNGLKKNNTFAPLYNIKGMALEKRLRYSEAIACFKKARRFQKKESYETLLNLGRVCIKTNRKKEALDNLEKALALTSNEREREEVRALIKKAEQMLNIRRL